MCEEEAYEETGLRVSNLRFNGVLHFYFGDMSRADWIVFIYSTKTFEGSPKPSVGGASMVPSGWDTLPGDVAG